PTLLRLGQLVRRPEALQQDPPEMTEIRMAPLAVLHGDLAFAVEHAEPERAVEIGHDDQIPAFRRDVPQVGHRGGEYPDVAPGGPGWRDRWVHLHPPLRGLNLIMCVLKQLSYLMSKQGMIRGGRLVGRPRPDGEGCGDQRGEQGQKEELAEPEAELSHGR